MTNKPKPITKKTLRLMFARQLEESVEKARNGLLPPGEGEMVIPHGTLNEVLVEPAGAWAEAQFCLRFLGKKAPMLLPLVPGWASFSQGLGSISAIPMACGHFPQLMRNPWDLPASLQEGKAWECTNSLPEMDCWIANPKQRLACTLIAIGICRLAGELDRAQEYLASIREEIPAEYYQNEAGACAWAHGQRKAALKHWKSAGDLPMALFNRGLADACAGDFQQAQGCFQEALKAISASSGWHHLAALYLQSA